MGDAAAPFLCALQKFVSAQASDVNGSNVAHDPGAVGGVGLRLDDPADNQRSVAAPVLEQKCDFRSRIGGVKPHKRPGRYGMVLLISRKHDKGPTAVKAHQEANDHTFDGLFGHDRPGGLPAFGECILLSALQKGEILAALTAPAGHDRNISCNVDRMECF